MIEATLIKQKTESYIRNKTQQIKRKNGRPQLCGSLVWTRETEQKCQLSILCISLVWTRETKDVTFNPLFAIVQKLGDSCNKKHHKINKKFVQEKTRLHNI